MSESAKAKFYIKLTDVFLNGRKVKRLETMQDGHSLVLLLIHLLSDAKNTEGVLLDDMGTELVPLDAASIHDEHPSFSVKFIEGALSKYIEVGLLQRADDGVFEFIDYEGLTNTKDAIKQKRYRDRKRAEGLTNE